MKIQSTEEELAKKQAMKGSIRTYAKGGKWKRPYPKCQMKVSGSMIQIFGGTAVPVQEYERSVEEAVRRLKHKLAMLREGLGRKEKRLEHLKTLPPERIVFGTKNCMHRRMPWGVMIRISRHGSRGFLIKGTAT